jgi:hypothetical protein
LPARWRLSSLSTCSWRFCGRTTWRSSTIPGISASLVTQTHGRLASGGLPYTPFLGLGGIPLKVYVASAFSLGLSLGTVLLWTVFARVVRIAPTYAVAAAIRLLFGRQIDARPGVWLAVFGLFWLVFYVFYFARMAG